MIRFIYDVKECYKNKKIYIWDLNSSSVEMTAYALFKGVFVEGFILRRNMFLDKTFINRTIIELDSAKELSDGVLVLSDVCDQNIFSYLGNELSNMELIHESDLYSISHSLKHKTVFVYGTGGGAVALSELLEKEDVQIKAFVQTETEPFIADSRLIPAIISLWV